MASSLGVLPPAAAPRDRAIFCQQLRERNILVRELSEQIRRSDLEIEGLRSAVLSHQSTEERLAGELEQLRKRIDSQPEAPAAPSVDSEESHAHALALLRHELLALRGAMEASRVCEGLFESERLARSTLSEEATSSFLSILSSFLSPRRGLLDGDDSTALADKLAEQERLSIEREAYWVAQCEALRLAAQSDERALLAVFEERMLAQRRALLSMAAQEREDDDPANSWFGTSDGH